MIKHDFFENLVKIANLGGAKGEKFKCYIFDRKGFIFEALFRNRKPFFNIMSGLGHRPDQIYYLWKYTLGGP